MRCFATAGDAEPLCPVVADGTDRQQETVHCHPKCPQREDAYQRL